MTGSEDEKLKEYYEKRDFSRTPEPPPGTGAQAGGRRPIYVIQKHHASHLHYDLRLEHEGVLKSWAIPKEPPRTPGPRRLAVQTEDHPLEYADFEGVIPEGEYGAGRVEIWDRGWHEPLEWEEDKVHIRIHGEKLQGEYLLIRFQPGKAPKNWLFFKRR